MNFHTSGCTFSASEYKYEVINYINDEFITNCKLKVSDYQSYENHDSIVLNIDFDIDFFSFPDSINLHIIDDDSFKFLLDIVTKCYEFQRFINKTKEVKPKISSFSLKHHNFIPNDINSLYFHLEIHLETNKSVSLFFKDIKNRTDLSNLVKNLNVKNLKY